VLADGWRKTIMRTTLRGALKFSTRRSTGIGRSGSSAGFGSTTANVDGGLDSGIPLRAPDDSWGGYAGSSVDITRG
jgi:hypothetical protein